MKALFGIALLGWVCACSASGGPERPNVVIVVLDTTRADVLSSYGNAAPTTPHLDRLAREGGRFTRAYATDFWTLPSHASLLTGQYPSVHRATSETNRLPSRAETLPEVLRRAGYRTAAFISNPWVSAERGFSQGFETFQETWRPRAGLAHEDRGGLELAKRWLQARGADPSPFLFFLNFNTAHMPYTPAPDVLSALHPEPIDPARGARLRKITGLWRHLAGREPLEQRDFEVLRRLYEAEIAMTDAIVGELIDELRTQGLLDDTLVIVTADHGENIGDHGMIDHMLSLYETTTRVPLIVRFPSRVEAGTVDDGLASLIDIPATVLDACGLPDDLLDSPGRSLLASPRSPAPFVIAENERPANGVELLNGAFPDFDTTEIDHPMRMLRTPDYKLIWRGDGAVELFDLEADPDEETDLAKRRPDVTARLSAQLQAWMQEVRPEEPSEALFESQDAQSLEELRALGYIE